jgi:hypothetical protein
MTLDDIKILIAKINSKKDDPEAAHGNEDNLHVAFIRHVAEVGDPTLKEMAIEILKTDKISFDRWCA